MSKLVKTMLFWIMIYPILTTTIIIIIDIFKGKSIQITSYFSNLLGFAVGGIIVGFVVYHSKKLLEEK